MMPMPKRLLLAAVMAIAFVISPGQGAAQGGLCDPNRVLQILSGVSHRFEGAGPALERSGGDAALLARVVHAARHQIIRDSDPGRKLDQIAARMSKAGTHRHTPAPTLTDGERQYFDWWTTACARAASATEQFPNSAGSGNFTSDAHDASPAAAGRGATGANDSTGQRETGRPGRPSSSGPLTYSGGLVGMIMATLAGALAVAMYATERDNRAAVRHSCHAHSSIRVGTTCFPILIVDISRLGCKIQFEQTPPVQKVCDVWIDGRYRPGRMLWSNRHFAGIKLDKPLDRNAVRATIRSDQRGAVTGLSTPTGTHQEQRNARVPA